MEATEGLHWPIVRIAIVADGVPHAKSHASPVQAKLTLRFGGLTARHTKQLWTMRAKTALTRAQMLIGRAKSGRMYQMYGIAKPKTTLRRHMTPGSVAEAGMMIAEAPRVQVRPI